MCEGVITTPGNEPANLSQPQERNRVGLEVWGVAEVMGYMSRSSPVGFWLWMCTGTPEIEGCGDTGGTRGYPNRELTCVAASWGEDIT